jgi:predicted RNA binding protein YcfA (HicA-like mRNA interferase family)
MTRIAKLYNRLLSGRALTFAEFQTLILAFGFELDRIKGSHHVYKRPGIIDRVNAQPKGKDAKSYQVQQFLDMVEANGLKLDESE